MGTIGIKKIPSIATPLAGRVNLAVKTDNILYMKDENGVETPVGVSGPIDEASQTTGTVISFDSRKIYGTAVSSESANITDDLTGAKLGIVQKIYHNSGTEPTVPVGWVLLGDGIYFTGQLNIIYAEWCGGTRVEYWIIQEQ